MLAKHKTLSLCLLLLVHPTVFGMEPDKSSWKKPVAITGVVAVGTGVLWGLWHLKHTLTHAMQDYAAMNFRTVTSTDAANKLWEETYRSYITATNPADRVVAVRLFEALYNHCSSTEGLKTDEDLATWQAHLELFKQAIEKK